MGKISLGDKYFDCLPFGLIVVLPNCQIESCNQVALHLLELSIDDFLVKDVLHLIPLPEFRHAFAEVRGGCVGEENFVTECYGKVLRFSVNRPPTVPVNESKVVITVEDFAAFQRMEMMKQKLIDAVLFNLRTPLASLKTALGILHSGKVGGLPSDANEIIGISRQEVNRLHFLVEELRHLLYIETGLVQAELDIEQFELSQALARALESLARLPNPFKDVRKRLAVDGDLDLLVRADFEKTRQILFAILKNAITYSPKASALAIRIGEKGTFAVLEVTDQGIGISNDKVALVFEKFYREDNEINRSTPGNGLGLFIAKSLVELMQGSIYCESEKGKGSKFCVSLPRA